MTNITQIAAGNNHIVALDANGNVWRWGDNHMDSLETVLQYHQTVL